MAKNGRPVRREGTVFACLVDLWQRREYKDQADIVLACFVGCSAELARQARIEAVEVHGAKLLPVRKGRFMKVKHTSHKYPSGRKIEWVAYQRC